MSKSNVKTIYFYEGETEKNLLKTLQSLENIPNGKLKKFNLWEKDIKKLFRTFQKTDHLRFLIDTDTMSPSSTFVKNIRQLNTYNFDLIIQNQNLEDELQISCRKPNTIALFMDFYDVRSKKEFKPCFAQDKNLQAKLTTQSFSFSLLWTNTSKFDSFCTSNDITPSIFKNP